MEKNDKVFLERKTTLKRKARMLTDLCNSKVCLVIYDSKGNLDVWPEDSTNAHSIINNYYTKLESMKRKNNEVCLSNVLEKKLRKLEEKVSCTITTTSTLNGDSSLSLNWDEKLAVLSKNSLMDMAQCLKAKIKVLDEKIDMVKGKDQAILQTLIQNNHDHQFEDDYFSSLPPLLTLPPPPPMPQTYVPLNYEEIQEIYDRSKIPFGQCYEINNDLVHSSKLHYSDFGYYNGDHLQACLQFPVPSSAATYTSNNFWQPSGI
ncbi:hypothetical protein CsatA_002144 [Cannabis sativa]